MKRVVFSILVDNTSGVLSRIAGLFSRRGYNIDSLTVGRTADDRYSRATVVANGDEIILQQIENQLNKLVDVIKLKRIHPYENISRELMLIKVAYNESTRGDVIDIARVMQAKISDISPTTVTIEISDTSERLEIMQQLLKPYGILEVIRTGTIAIQKGSDVIN